MFQVDANIVEKYRELFDHSRQQWDSYFRQYLPDFQDYFLTPDNFELILRIFSEHSIRTNNNNHDVHQMDILSRVLGKILVRDSIRPTLDNARELAQRLKAISPDKIEIFELCTGAGLATTMTYREMKKVFPEKNISDLYRYFTRVIVNRADFIKFSQNTSVHC